MTDEQLLAACQHYGRAALQWRNKFIGLLPEVFRRKLYLQGGCSGIMEFGKKFAGLSEEQIRLTLNLRERFHNKPKLKELLESGTVSINKLTRIASIATPDNEEELAERVQILGQSSIETMVRDHKMEIEQGFRKAESLRTQTLPEQIEILGNDKGLNLATDVAAQLLDLQQKGIDINEFLRGALSARDEQIQTTKNELAKTCEQTNSRYIPEKIKAIVREEYGTKCSIKHCNKPSKEIHHTQRFSVAHMHDPNYLAPMCHEHHALAHAADVKVQEIKIGEARQANWPQEENSTTAPHQRASLVSPP